MQELQFTSMQLSTVQIINVTVNLVVRSMMELRLFNITFLLQEMHMLVEVRIHNELV
jgi:hypothetical protein